MGDRFRNIGDLGIGISAEMVLGAIAPFVQARASWIDRLKSIAWLRHGTVKRVAAKLRHGGRRDAAVIESEYDTAWSRRYDAYDLEAGCRKPEPWIYGRRPMAVDRAGVPRMRSVMLAGVLRTLKPSRVLEVGCGNGINLLLLAGAFPDIEFFGLELTSAGHRVACELQQADELPRALAKYAPEPQRDAEAFRRITFLQGDATRMPFPDAAFDLVFTVLAVEQMARNRDTALAEIARVSRGYVLNLEPFADANRSLWRRLHVAARDYFKGAIGDLPRYGLYPQWATADYPQELQLGTALVLSRRQRSSGPDPLPEVRPGG